LSVLHGGSPEVRGDGQPLLSRRSFDQLVLFKGDAGLDEHFLGWHHYPYDENIGSYVTMDSTLN
jgi:hypothetical protein